MIVKSVLVSSRFGDPRSYPIEKIQVIRHHGVRGDTHAGPRLCDVREASIRAHGIPKGTEIANTREFSAVSSEELEAIASAMGVPEIPEGALGQNLVLEGVPGLTQLPAGTLLMFRDQKGNPRTAVLAVWAENTPCVIPGQEIQKHYPDRSGLANLFPKAAVKRRGVVGFVYCSGFIQQGDQVVVVTP
jgi:hypothetical protein